MRQEPKYVYLMRHRLTCSCGKPMYCASLQKGRYLYYRCITNGAKGDYCNSKKKLFDVVKVDGIIWAWLESLLAEPAKVKQSVKEYLCQLEQETIPYRLRQEALNNLIENTIEAQNRLLDLYESKAIDKTLLIPRMEEYKKKIADYQEELEVVEIMISQNEASKGLEF